MSLPIELVEILGHGHRRKESLVHLRDYLMYTTQKLSASMHSFVTQHLLGVSYPITHHVSGDNFSMQHRHFLAAVTSGDEPMTFLEATQDERWREAMQKEI